MDIFLTCAGMPNATIIATKRIMETLPKRFHVKHIAMPHSLIVIYQNHSLYTQQ